MANNNFIISPLNLNRDEIKNLAVVEVNSILDVRVKLIDQHSVCPFCGGHTKKRVYNNLSIAGKQRILPLLMLFTLYNFIARFHKTLQNFTEGLFLFIIFRFIKHSIF